MKVSVLSLLVVLLAVPALRAQDSELDVLQTRRAFVAAVNVGSIEVLARLLAKDAMLSTITTTKLLMGNAAVAPAPARLGGRDAIVAYFTREFAGGRIRLMAQQSDQSADMATESGKLSFQPFPFGVGITTDGEYRIALIRTDEGWRINDVQLESESGVRRSSSPRFDNRVPVVPRPRPVPPPRREPLPPPRFGIVPLIA